MLKSALDVAKSIKARELFIYIDSLDELQIPENLPKGCELILVSKKQSSELTELETQVKKIIYIPKINLGRLGLIKLTMALAISQQLVNSGDRVVFLSGTSELRLL